MSRRPYLILTYACRRDTLISAIFISVSTLLPILNVSQSYKLKTWITLAGALFTDSIIMNSLSGYSKSMISNNASFILFSKGVLHNSHSRAFQKKLLTLSPLYTSFFELSHSFKQLMCIYFIVPSHLQGQINSFMFILSLHISSSPKHILHTFYSFYFD